MRPATQILARDRLHARLRTGLLESGGLALAIGPQLLADALWRRPDRLAGDSAMQLHDLPAPWLVLMLGALTAFNQILVDHLVQQHAAVGDELAAALLALLGGAKRIPSLQKLRAIVKTACRRGVVHPQD